jgi:hypothetical protein
MMARQAKPFDWRLYEFTLDELDFLPGKNDDKLDSTVECKAHNDQQNLAEIVSKLESSRFYGSLEIKFEAATLCCSGKPKP